MYEHVVHVFCGLIQVQQQTWAPDLCCKHCSYRCRNLCRLLNHFMFLQLDVHHSFDVVCCMVSINQKEEKKKIKFRARIFYQNEFRRRVHGQHLQHHHQIYIIETQTHPLSLRNMLFMERATYSNFRAPVGIHHVAGVHWIEIVMIAMNPSLTPRLRFVAFYLRTIQ